MAHAAEDIQAHVRLYLKVFLALGILTLVTVGVAYLHLPHTPAVLVALFIAAAKASLVAMFFMHLKGERPIIFWSLAVTAAFFVFLFALPMWTEGDHIVGTRPDAWSAGAAAPHAPAHSPGPH
jgi:cytochrome c oxidase subunit 4